jgi:hypothetical protein
MLEYAKKYEDKLRELFLNTSFDPFYRFSYCMCYRDVFELPKDTWNSMPFVSVYNDSILGMIEYKIKRPENAVWELFLVHFGGKDALCPYIFGKDVITAIKDIFEKYHFNKLNFSVVQGNPIEKTYDKLIRRYNGRIVGIKEQETRLIDGKIYDIKEYELLAERYFMKKSRAEDQNG